MSGGNKKPKRRAEPVFTSKVRINLDNEIDECLVYVNIKLHRWMISKH